MARSHGVSFRPRCSVNATGGMVEFVRRRHMGTLLCNIALVKPGIILEVFIVVFFVRN